jgi:hypothetical protein
MADFIRIEHPDIERQPADQLPLVTREAFDDFWSAKGWVEAGGDDPPVAAVEVPSPAPLAAPTADAPAAPAEAPAADAEAPAEDPAPTDDPAADTDQAATETTAARHARTR